MNSPAARDRSSLFPLLYQSTAGTFLVLVTTGVFLFFFYQPSAAASWGDLYDISDTGSISQTVQIVHRWSSFLLVLLGLGTAMAGLAQRGLSLGRRLGLLTLPVLAGAGLFSGLLLPWEQMALYAVEVGTNMQGYLVVFDDRVKFFLGDQGVTGTGSMAWYLGAHLAISLLIALVLALARAVTTRT